ncbi:MAG: cytochrome c, class [Bryobacterales bacterium]|nr:cytochrome c, class [Bryobacterales bacterium]
MILRALWLFAAGLPLDAQLISRPVPPPDAVERGQKQFVAQCGFCHGPLARGGESGPDLVRSEIVLDDEQGSLIGPVIRKGRPNEGMPAFDLPDPQIQDLAAFLRERTQAAINRNAYAIQDVLTGDRKAGEAYFNGAGRCNTCHSAAGDLAGIASRFQPVQLQTRFLYPRGGRGGAPARPTIVTVKPVTGRAVSGTLEFIDDFTLGLRDAEGYYRSFPRDSVKVDIKDPLAAHAQLLRQYTDKNMHDVLAYLATLK